MTKVICFGTFDVLHPGHLNYFKQAKKHGNYLIIVIARDQTKKLQNKPLLFNEKQRLKIIQNLKIVDQAVLGSLTDHFQVIKKLKPHIICLGYDHQIKIPELKAKLKKLHLTPKIKRMQPYQTKKYKSSKLKTLFLR